MSAESTDAPPLEGKPKLLFHPSFNERRPGSVILQADDADKLCFYFPLSLLAELSSFFKDLPKPSDVDLVDGIPLIPLHGTPSGGLLVCLWAVESITNGPNPCPLPSAVLARDQFFLVQAAVIAKKYDLPIVQRLLLEALIPVPSAELLRFTLAAIAGAKAIPSLAEATLDTDLTAAPKFLIDALTEYAPACFIKLQNLDIRRAAAPHRFQTSRLGGSSGHRMACDAPSHPRSEISTIEDLFSAARTIEEVQEVAAGDFGMSCRTCIAYTRGYYKPRLAALVEFISKYDYDQDKARLL